MINFKELDSLYTVDTESGLFCYLHRKDSLITFNDELKVSEAFELVKNRKIVKAFSISSSFSNLQDYVYIRQLNEEAKIVGGDTFVMMFTHLENLITKQPITIPENFTKVNPEYVDSTVESINRVFWLAPESDDPKEKEFVEKLIKLNRTAKVVKGGRRFSFSALTIVGDKKGKVGFGFGKANDVTEAIRKSVDKAKRNMVTVPLKNGTIPHEIQAEYKSSSVLLKPACSGTGIIAGGPVRAVLEAAGATDVMSKSLGSNTSVNVVRATFEAVKGLMNASEVAKNRSKTLKDLWG